MLEVLKKLNSNLQFFDVNSAEFSTFGRVIKNLDISEITAVAERMEAPKEGSAYSPAVKEFEALPIAKNIQNEFYGTLPTQVGYCFGRNNFLNAAEWHTSSEINIAITPLVLLLGHVWDIKDGEIDSSCFKAFYLPKGTVVEVYATSLHFCPCEVQSQGFGCVVALPSDTNTDLEEKTEDVRLYRKNKWIIAHKDNKALINKGVVAGITGENYEVKY